MIHPSLAAHDARQKSGVSSATPEDDRPTIDKPPRGELWEIAENLHRAELTKLQHDEQVALWIKLTDEKEVSRVLRAKPQGGRPEGGVRENVTTVAVV
jgi:hypothetical protein